MLTSRWPEDIVTQLIECEHRAYTSSNVCPPRHLCLRALTELGPSDVRVVILGQDPYHTPGKANGLAFGYSDDYEGPTDSSMANIVSELRTDLFDFSLSDWSQQGVLLLNTRLSVLEGKPMSHASIGWEEPVSEILKWLDRQHGDRIVWLLWGREARLTAENAGIDASLPNVIATSHPCRYSHTSTSSPFTGSNCFNRANEYLVSIGSQPIRWYNE